MYITCLDMEGPLVPEIWIEFAKATGIDELLITTRDEPDYHKLMDYRLDILIQMGPNPNTNWGASALSLPPDNMK